jgi:diadenosine tetraphosphate (Ap4A) HIT family hydrolase
MECFSCKSNSGEKRISPGPTIYEGAYWYVEHAYPCGMLGWLVLVLKRHAEALHELSMEEMREMAELQAVGARLLKSAVDCRKEYLMCYAEAEGFQHMHVHLVARAHDLAGELIGPRIFAMLKVGEEGAVPRNEVKVFCEELRDQFAPAYEALLSTKARVPSGERGHSGGANGRP